MGRMLLERVVKSRYIHRRVDTIEFIGATRIRRRVSLDVEVPAGSALGTEGSDGQEAVVPLTFFAKRRDEHDQAVHRAFDVRDEQGAAVPILGHYENALAAWALLIGATVSNLDHLTEDERESLWRVAAAPARSATQEARLLLGPDLDPQWYSNVFQARTLQEYQYLLAKFANDYLVIACLDTRGRGTRRIVKYAYDVPLPYRPPWPLSTASARHFSARIGWGAADFEFNLRSSLPVSSMHFEIRTPPELEVVAARMEAVTEFIGDLAPQRKVAEDNYLKQFRSIAHLHLAGVSGRDAVRSEVWIRVRRGTVPWVAFLAGLSVAVLLMLGHQWPHYAVRGQDAARSLLLLFPGLLAGAVLIRQEHTLVARMMMGIRLLVLGLVGLSVLTVLLFFVTSTYDSSGAMDVERSAAALRSWLRWLRFGGLVVAALLLPAVLPIRPRRTGRA